MGVKISKVEPPSTLLQLPPEILTHILSFCSFQEIVQSSRVCKSCSNITRSKRMWRKILTEVEEETITLVVELSDDVIPNLKNIRSNVNDVPRLSYLQDTLHSIGIYLSNNKQEKPSTDSMNKVSISTYCIWTGLLLRNLKQCKKFFDRLANNLLTENFDLMDLCLRRYLGQFENLFPFQRPIMYPSLAIQNMDARNYWETVFGKETYFVSFDRFYNEVIIGFFDGKSDPDFETLLSYFVNFPKDDQVSTYKFYLITSIFGFKNFKQNFVKYVLEKGFLGLINSIKAEEILGDQKDDVFLLRFSRMVPEVITVSVKKNGAIFHFRHTDEKNVPKSIDSIGDGSENLVPIAMKLSPKTIKVSIVTGYITTISSNQVLFKPINQLRIVPSE